MQPVARAIKDAGGVDQYVYERVRDFLARQSVRARDSTILL
jgi:hypothetical protein